MPRERILGAAAKLFRERGYQGTTVRDIAELVGILSGSLFYHFRSKEEMLAEIMREAARSMCERAEATVAGPGAPRDHLRALVGLELECLIGEATKDYYAVLVFEWRVVPEEAKSELAEWRRRYRGLWRNVLAACAEEGLLRCAPEAAHQVLHSSTTGTMTWFKPSGRYSVDEYADILTQLVLN